MDNKTPLAVSASTYAIKQSIKNQTVKTKTGTYKKAAKFCFNKKNYVEFGISKYTVEQILSLGDKISSAFLEEK
jgi:hypothetical protein